MRRPRDLLDSGDDGLCQANVYWAEARVCYWKENQPHPTPRQYRRVAAWLRKVADWYDWLATKQEAKR